MLSEEISLAEYLRLQKPKNKHNAQRTERDGIWFHSGKEADRFSQLKILERCGQIKNLTLQPKFILTVNDIKIGTWSGDFSYLDVRTGEPVIEDCKGYRDKLYKWKKAHFEAQYGRRILET